MTILTTSYNCAEYIEKCINSIRTQTYTDFKCYITDDLSTDNTREVVKKVIDGDDRFILIENETKMYQAGNYDNVIRNLNLDGNEICVEVDGDDWLPNSGVFQKINDVYSKDDVWLTSGSFKYHDGRKGFANPPTTDIDVRKQVFTLSHLRTWKAWLWNKIDPRDLRDENNQYWNVSGDLAFMFPMFEMSGIEHFKFLNDVNYVYNESNPINEHKVYMNRVVNTTNKIRNKKPYSKII